MRRWDNEISLGEAIKMLIKSYGLGPKVNEAKLREQWSEIVGAPIAKYTTEISLRGTTLMIKVASAPLRQELQYAREQIMQNINDRFEEEIVCEVILR